MIYTEGKPGSLMTDEKIAQLQQHNQAGIERSKQALGKTWLMHPDNKVQRIDRRRVLETIPAYLLKS
ncbi:MAG TPA: hypothetical protein VFM18_22655 [Methanosarcina sp.]|nr:hypothetical protein [Methanosarcina sp.]